MRTRKIASCIVLIWTSLLAAKAGTDLNGVWTGEVRGQEGGMGRVRFVLQQEAGRISGTAGPVEKQNPGKIYDAKLDGDHLTFAADHTDESTGLSLTYHFDLTVGKDRMQGKAHGSSGDRSWTLDIAMTRGK